MTIADILTLTGIVVSIIFGFFITHFHSIRDTRTRVLKDYYIEQIKTIKGRIDSFFHQIVFGKSSFRKVVNWYDHFCIDVKSLDQGTRKFLDLQIEEIEEVFDNFYGEITDWDDFNDQCSNSTYHPSVVHRQRLIQMKYEVDNFLNDYISHVNQANNYPIWKTQWNRIKRSRIYYTKNKDKHPLLHALGERAEKHFWEIITSIVLICAVIYLSMNVKKEEKVDLATPLKEISKKQDLIQKSIINFKDKYKPVEIHSKTFNNSSFFNANNVDSVEIQLYQTRKYDR